MRAIPISTKSIVLTLTLCNVLILSRCTKGAMKLAIDAQTSHCLKCDFGGVLF